MAKRMVLASRAADGHLELLEPFDLPQGETFPVTLEIPEKRQLADAAQRVDLPKWPGVAIGHLSRDEIYGDVG